MAPKPNRTKGNAKASSSAAASDYVARAQTASPTGFVGFQTLQQNPVLLASGKDNAEDDPASGVADEYRVVFKRLLKKDTVTRTKALNELGQLVRSGQPDSVAQVLGYWVPLYRKLALDPDRTVRTASNAVLLDFVRVAKRNLAPVLKRLLPVWLVSQFDTCRDVAAAAEAAFTAAFPPHKRGEALQFCRDDIVAFIAENVLESGAAPEAGDAAADSQYTRTVASSLAALAFFMSMVPPDTLKECMQQFYSSKKFWKLAQSPYPEVRIGIYSVVQKQSLLSPEVFEAYYGLASPAVVAALGEQDRAAQPAMWEAVLAYLRACPPALQHVNLQKAFLPRLRTLLRSGGHGNPRVAMPCVLPLLSCIAVSEAAPDPLAFYTEWLANTWAGVSAYATLDDAGPVVLAYVECLQYAAQAGGQPTLLCTELVPRLVNPEGEPAVQRVFYKRACLHLRGMAEKPDMSDAMAAFWSTLIPRMEDSVEAGDPAATGRASMLVEALCAASEANTLPPSYESGVVRLLTAFTKASLLKGSSQVALLESVYRAARTAHLETALAASLETKDLQHLLIEFALPHLKQMLAAPDADRRDGLALVSLLCCIVVSGGPDTLWKTLCADLCEPSRVREHADFLVAAVEQISNGAEGDVRRFRSEELDNAVAVALDDPQAWEPGTAVHQLLVRCLSGGRSRRLVEDGSVERVLERICAHLEKDAFAAAVASAPQSRAMLGVAEAYLAGIENAHDPLVDCAPRLLAAVLALSTRTLHDESEPDLAPLCLEVFEAAMSQLARDQFPAKRQSVATCCIANIHRALLDSDHPSVEDLVGEMAVVMSQVCANDSERTQAVDQAILPVSAWNRLRKLPRMPPVPAYVAGWLLVPDEEGNVEHDLPPDVLAEVVRRLLRLVEYTAALVGLAGVQNFIMAHASEEESLALLMDRMLPVVQLMHSRVWAQHTLAAKNLEHASQGDVLWATELQRIMGLADPSIASIIQTIKLAEPEERMRVGKTISEQFGQLAFNRQGLYLATYAHWLDALFKAGVIGRPRGEAILANGLMGDFETSMDETQTLLATLAGISQHLPRAAALASLRDACLVCALGTAPAEVWTAPLQSTAMLALTISCIHPNKVGGDEGVHWACLNEGSCATQLIKHFKSQFAPAQQAARRRATHKLSLEELNARMQMARLLDLLLKKMLHSNSLPPSFVQIIVDSASEFLEASVTGATILHYGLAARALEQLHLVAARITLPVNARAAAVREVTDADSDDDDEETIDMDTLAGQEDLSKVWTSSEDFLARMTSTIMLESKTGIDTQPLLKPLWARRLMLVELRKLLPHLTNKLVSSGDVARNQATLHTLLLAQNVDTQIMSYSLLEALLQTQREAGDDVGDDTDAALAPAVVDVLLSSPEASVGGEVAPDSVASRHWLLGFFLAWLLVLQRFEQSLPEHRAQLAAQLSSLACVDRMMRAVFALVVPVGIPLPQYTAALKAFNVKGIDVHEGDGLVLLAGFVYMRALMVIPALCRMWFNDAPRAVRDTVERYTADYVSPLLIAHEIQALKSASKSSSGVDMKVRGSAVSRQVTATYQLDEVNLELTITMPANFPLGMVTVDSSTDMGIKNYRKWLLQITTFLSSQNGSIMDALLLWKRNVDKRTEGVDECTICYSVIHGTNYQLPKLSCRTCKHKFHSTCLYKWFQSSTQSTCPLCRSEFS